MKIYLIWGFLGSGKTTFINHALKHFLEGQRVVIIENEVGKNSIDTIYLRNQSYNVVDMNTGCVCCTLRAELPITIKQIEQEISPDIVIIEPSGIAQLNDLLPTLKHYQTGIVAIADASRWAMLMKLNRTHYLKQFTLSNTIVISKSELCNDGQISAVISDIEQSNPIAHIEPHYALLSHEQGAQLFEQATIDHTKPSFSYLGTQDTLLHFETFSVNPSRTYTIAEVDNLLSTLTTDSLYGDIIRIKGFVELSHGNYLKLDSVFGQHTYSKFETTERITPQITFIGKSLNPTQILHDCDNTSI